MRTAELPLLPAELAGLVLILLAAVLLAGGLAGSSLTSTELGRWVLAAGLLLLLGAALATVLTATGSGPRARSPPGDPWLFRGFGREPGLPPEPSGDEPGLTRLPPTSSAGPNVPTLPPISSSIPGAYLAAIEAPDSVPSAGWADPMPPIAAALPFAAMPRAPELSGRGDEQGEPTAVLEVELARLRARLREIEHSSNASPAPRLDVSGGTRTALPLTSGAEGRLSPRPPSAARRTCAGCGVGVASSGSPSLCSSCGRLLCDSCAARSGGSAGLLYCPDCVGRREAQGTPSLSGGRSVSEFTNGFGGRPEERSGPADRR
ncbi:MAG TPA: hypothetical protein VFG07_09745 [Thermoplasmata archaeon]|nr:hypothetical protein [Thermoplasmata archaeon]